MANNNTKCGACIKHDEHDYLEVVDICDNRDDARAKYRNPRSVIISLIQQHSDVVIGSKVKLRGEYLVTLDNL